MTCVGILLNDLKLNSAQSSILNIGDLLGRRVIDDVVLHFDGLPVLADVRWAYLSDAALTI